MQIIVNASTPFAPADSKPLTSRGEFYQNALFALGCKPDNPPLGDFLRRAMHLEGQWLIASPIHWEATHNDAMIVAAGAELALDDSESRLLFEQVTDFLKGYEIQSAYFSPHLWLLKIDHLPAITSQSISNMLHHSMMPVISEMDKTFFWQRLLTEIQMFLSAHPLNSARDHSLIVNGLWLWGEGAFKPSTSQMIYSDDDIFLSPPHNSIAIVHKLDATNQFGKNSLLLIKHPQRWDLQKLRQQTQNNQSQWYWNNLAYSLKPRGWWSRLWRK
ncbi:hypothetical protein [Legionella jordanis]|uniref:Cofactor-independent phosphoglycerate mutase n=1 Tax=Legionella jordanis TaxID=456 RepID=A0A0W0VAS4_9GAMM|nr:hypothetical protein [Legionella jordanis]KTD17230.1 hypothetical protein Ljor_1536 [Legionella jordanis]RMX03347.1 hypothetical protein EAW55_07990 [Legionella jordanis]RMX15826.1 hypothetical protein EAS68_11345 [Legionella jordanis]VEH12572.1 Uncharacterized protein conserved in bacteria [Legionella jordanis]HAT8713354.1 hypothetical protein [Legionella jordanis]